MFWWTHNLNNLKSRTVHPNYLRITPAFAAGLERSGKPVRQHALVKFSLHWRQSDHNIYAPLPLDQAQHQ